MKKQIVLILLMYLTLSAKMLAQVYYMKQRDFSNIPSNVLDEINHMGVVGNICLTELEGKYFNALYQIDEQRYNLCGRKVAFLTGSLGKTKSNKVNYFHLERKRLDSNSSPNMGTLYFFNDTQKQACGGYDATIVYWSKKTLSIYEVIKRIKNVQ